MNKENKNTNSDYEEDDERPVPEGGPCRYFYKGVEKTAFNRSAYLIDEALVAKGQDYN